jgi:hypothetical protein
MSSTGAECESLRLWQKADQTFFLRCWISAIERKADIPSAAQNVR